MRVCMRMRVAVMFSRPVLMFMIMVMVMRVILMMAVVIRVPGSVGMFVMMSRGAHRVFSR